MASMEDVKVGKKLLIDWIPYEVMKSEHNKVAQGKWMERTVLKNLLTWATLQKTFREVDKIEMANITMSNAEYLYEDGDGYHFMNTESYEQTQLSRDVVWETKFFLVEWDRVLLQEFNGNPINVQVEPAVILEVTETPPWEKWDTATWWRKPATLSTWLVVQVPLFVKPWDKIRVDTRTSEYLSRA